MRLWRNSIPPGGGWPGRALRPQTWELRFNGFPCGYQGSGYYRDFQRADRIVLRHPPTLTVDSVKYDEGDGVETTLVEDTAFA